MYKSICEGVISYFEKKLRVRWNKLYGPKEKVQLRNWRMNYY